ncbi:MAG: FHA domain-containing protein [Deltaproteobacteria bacterium]|nr:FHA domain-containing protein [Deltaproteobacteria bacterium]NND30930.1 FHA domain-containing protein [Myxococcales bacterium]MBT8463830.1 FHA domain-containing protein [Deltaproteobacteria bacterium]MBT8481105.1 FHA domain-containing protein [Deltaproteobacteria bacterium]NNK06854.1 FHA domain-containing protein [Myxococcales bacterium]
MARFRLRYQSTNLELRLGEFAIGRSSACNLAVADGLVSRKHAVLRVEPEAVVLEDLGSRNGVAVNGVRIEGACPLQHMDRVYIGSQELVLIDADKMNERATTDRHVACDVCGAINGSAKRYCGDCGARLESESSATWREQDRPAVPRAVPSMRVEDSEREWGGSESTHTARALDVLGTIASKAITMGRFDEAERILIPHLDALLERAMRHRPLSDSNKDDPEAMFATATGYALQLAQGPKDKRWIDWVFRIHTATARVMTAETIEALHEAVRRSEYRSGKYLRTYLQVIEKRPKADYSPSERFLLGRLDGLAQVILAR